MPENPQTDIGCVLTPLEWACWAVERYQLVDKWLGGATILEPTAGRGAFLEAIIHLALKRGCTITDEALRRLFAVELKSDSREYFFKHLKSKYGIEFPPGNFVVGDFLLGDGFPVADYVIGNPPWTNFSDLPDDYKEKLKPVFHHYGLVSRGASTLLGGSRVDLAALVIAKAISECLQPNGKAYIYMPLSILLNDGAHDNFRSYCVNGIDFAVGEIHDQTAVGVFKGIGTRYCFCTFERDKQAQYPVPFHEYTVDGTVTEKTAFPAYGGSSPLLVASLDEKVPPPPVIKVARASYPRQGVNTCGANDVFIFDSYELIDDALCRLSNKLRKDIILPRDMVYPLLGKKQFVDPDAPPERYIFIPHDRITGKPLTEDLLRENEATWSYLESVREKLVNRRGTMINSKIKKGILWALLGVGEYSFAPYKIAWQAYGVKDFSPILFEGLWQANNALQAYMPFNDRDDAMRVLNELTNSSIEKYLTMHLTGSTCNWAQPGRIKKFLSES